MDKHFSGDDWSLRNTGQLYTPICLRHQKDIRINIARDMTSLFKNTGQLYIPISLRHQKDIRINIAREMTGLLGIQAN